ncbi:RNA polymerase sigma-70 factor, ECF subfamily [Siphonobacter aquaeclarae]|jgi:RNA polymerase sigma-70 factor (family 1)|uniref:RNA polymerase sigma-70 factor, ECF subfamily n=1 Tax=Siphonobacter aquaeclarae TaxID=563176 RepID=A0A1G9L9L4_9BACT|nr:RNA polymerase sigma-70 factor, ECF subfamily [Siphonobacter aquaeclarae]
MIVCAPTLNPVRVYSEPATLEALRQGDERAFETLFRKHYEALCRYANGILQDYDEAEEIVQQTFVKIWEQREDLYIEFSLKAYLYRAVHNHSLNRLKHYKIRQEYADHQQFFYQNDHARADDGLYQSDLEKKLADAIRQLPEQCRRIFEMSRFEELKYQEIADILGISPKTVENQIGKALKILRGELADFLPALMVSPLFWLLIEQYID